MTAPANVLHQKFLSTLSLRRATKKGSGKSTTLTNFYPRSPCGERRREKGDLFREVAISIHALLAESDPFCGRFCTFFLYFYPRSPCGERQETQKAKGSNKIFLSTLSLRRATRLRAGSLSQPRNFYPRSPCGERRCKTCGKFGLFLFLSTLSLRRATKHKTYQGGTHHISIHALLAESDSKKAAIGNPTLISIHALLAESDPGPNSMTPERY